MLRTKTNFRRFLCTRSRTFHGWQSFPISETEFIRMPFLTNLRIWQGNFVILRKKKICKFQVILQTFPCICDICPSHDRYHLFGCYCCSFSELFLSESLSTRISSLSFCTSGWMLVVGVANRSVLWNIFCARKLFSLHLSLLWQFEWMKMGSVGQCWTFFCIL